MAVCIKVYWSQTGSLCIQSLEVIINQCILYLHLYHPVLSFDISNMILQGPMMGDLSEVQVV